METKPGGVKAVHRSDDGTVDSWTRIEGDIESIDGLPPTAINQAHTSGDYQSGDNSAPTINFLEHTDYATMRAFAVGAGRAKKYFAFEFFDGTILATAVAVYPKVLLAPKAVRSEGDSAWSLTWNHDADTMLEPIESLT